MQCVGTVFTPEREQNGVAKRRECECQRTSRYRGNSAVCHIYLLICDLVGMIGC